MTGKMGPPGGADPGEVELVLNGERHTVARGTTLAAVVQLLAVHTRGVAVAVDREVVPRSAWDRVLVVDGATIEVVTAAAGG